MEKDLEHYRKLLTAERDRLIGELKSFADPDPKMKGDWDTRFPGREPGTSDFSHSAQDEQADAREEFETNIAQEHVLELRLAEVNRAVERLDDGSFGICRACQQTIPEARLDANPATEYDIEHQPRSES